MSESMRIHLEVRELVRAPADAAIVGVFEGERPLRGAAGLVDWRLCGVLSELVAAGDLGGRPGEVTLLASGGRLAAPALLAVGLGPRAGYGVPAFESAIEVAFRRAGELAYGRVALAPLGLHEEDYARHARALLDGALAGLGEAGLEVALCVPEPEEARVRRELVRAGRADRVEIVAPVPVRRVEDPSVAWPSPRN